MAIDPIKFQNNPYINAAQFGTNSTFGNKNNPSIFGSQKVDTNDFDGITVGGIVSSNVKAPAENETNFFGTSNPFIDENNGLTKSQRVNPAQNSNPLKGLGRDVYERIGNINKELIPEISAEHQWIG